MRPLQVAAASLARFALQQAEPSRQHHAQLPFQFALQLLIALGLGGLALQRVHLAGDFFQNVEHPRQVLLRAFQLGFRQPLAALVLA